jgi:hypothetical protein
MGNLVVGHAVRGEPLAEALDRLPPSVECVAYRDATTGAVLIDVFAGDHRPVLAFSRLPRLPSLAEELPAELAPLNALYEALLRQRRADPFRRRFVHLNLLLSRVLDMRVFSFVSDDDGLDLACSSLAGRLDRLRFATDAVELLWDQAQVAIQPLRFDDDQMLLEAELLALQGSLPGSRLCPVVECLASPHRIAVVECKGFLGAAVLGLGTGDGDRGAIEAIIQTRRQ